jgi:hypothetical protein
VTSAFSMIGLSLAALMGLCAVPALAETVTFECQTPNGAYYIKIGEPSLLNRFTNNDFRPDNVQFRHADDPEFTGTNVTRSDENGIRFTVNGALRGAPPETNVTEIVLGRTDPPHGYMTHWKVVRTDSGGSANRITWQNTQLRTDRNPSVSPLHQSFLIPA